MSEFAVRYRPAEEDSAPRDWVKSVCHVGEYRACNRTWAE